MSETLHNVRANDKPLPLNEKSNFGSIRAGDRRSDTDLALRYSKFGSITTDMTTETSTLDIPQNPASRRGWIIWQLRNRGWSLSRIALQEGVSVQAVSSALMVPSSHLQRVIADLLDLTPQQLFPEFYDRTGRRLGRTRDPQRITRSSSRNVEEEKAA